MDSLYQLGTLVYAKNNPYRNITDSLKDKERIDLLADTTEISKRNILKDDSGKWIIRGNKGQLQTFDSETYLLYVSSYSTRIWGWVKRKAKSLEWEITQDGDDEGCFRIALPNESQSRFLREVLGLRKRRGLGQAKPSITMGFQDLKIGVSEQFASCFKGPATQAPAHP